LLASFAFFAPWSVQFRKQMNVGIVTSMWSFENISSRRLILGSNCIACRQTWLSGRISDLQVSVSGYYGPGRPQRALAIIHYGPRASSRTAGHRSINSTVRSDLLTAEWGFLTPDSDWASAVTRQFSEISAADWRRRPLSWQASTYRACSPTAFSSTFIPQRCRVRRIQEKT
jgi:hypothetical protein